MKPPEPSPLPDGPDAQARASSARGKVWGICLALAGITLVAFGRALFCQFINFDDPDYVYENRVVSRGLTWNSIRWAFSFHAFNWHPLTWLSHMLDCQIYELHPAEHHATNLALHLAAVILLFLVLRRMTGALWQSAFAAAVFAVHPLRVESVAWISERKDVLGGFFFVLTVAAYVRYVRKPSVARYGLTVLLFALGLMSKPMLVTLPLILLLLDYWPLRRAIPPRKLILEKLPLLALSVGSSIATILAQHKAIQSIQVYPLGARLGNAAISCIVYLRQMVWPNGLAIFYPYPQGGFAGWEVALAAILVIGATVVVWMQRRARPWLLVGWGWYLIMLLPVIGIVQVGGQAHADRYTYLPQIGICIVVAWLAAEWVQRLRISKQAVGAATAVVVGVLAFCTWKQTGYWHDDETLWPHTIACTTNNEMSHYNLGFAFDKKGEMDQAIAEYREALRIRPNYGEALNNLGLALLQQGKVDEAMEYLQQAYQAGPNRAEPCVNIGSALLRKGRIDEAIARFQEALQLKADNPTAYNNLGDAFLQKGDVASASANYEKTLALDPDYPEANYSLGNILLQNGRIDEAIAYFIKAVHAKPDYAKAYNNLGNALAQKGREKDAIASYEKAWQLEPSDLAINNNLAWLLATASDGSLRNGSESIELAQRANLLSGRNNPMVLRTLAAALAQLGKYSDAVGVSRTAIAAARQAGQTNMLEVLNAEMKLYQTGRPFHP
jgi:protein O-mannosyl-transferase